MGMAHGFLHSTGQLHNLGSDSGGSIQVICDDREEFPMPMNHIRLRC